MYKIKFLENNTKKERTLEKIFPTYDYAAGFLDGRGYIKKDDNRFYPTNIKLSTVDSSYEVVNKQKEELSDDIAEIVNIKGGYYYDSNNIFN